MTTRVTLSTESAHINCQARTHTYRRTCALNIYHMSMFTHSANVGETERTIQVHIHIFFFPLEFLLTFSIQRKHFRSEICWFRTAIHTHKKEKRIDHISGVNCLFCAHSVIWSHVGSFVCLFGSS